MSETPFPPLPVEQKSNPEVLGFAPGLYAFQGRLLQCGNDFEVLNPLNNKLPDVTQEKLEKRNVNGIDNIVNNASTRERQEYWMGKEDNDYEKQKAKWIADTVSTFASGKEYFTKSKRGQRWTKLFSKLGVDAQSFTSSHAETLYSKYFTQDKGDTNVRSFIADVVNTYKQDNGKVNYEELKQDLDAIQWITHIFGDMSSTVISQYIDAEVQLINNPKQFVEEVNRKDDSKTSRINRVDEVEEKPYLDFLYGRGKAKSDGKPTAGPGPGSLDNYRFEYDEQSRKDPRNFPERREIMKLPDANAMAEELKKRNPGKYGQADTLFLARKIVDEREILRQSRQAMGLTDEFLIGSFNRALDRYKSFIRNTYGIDLPKLGKINILPISGLTAEYLNPREALAFVNFKYPIIFLDFGVIQKEAVKIAKREWTTFTLVELAQMMDRLLVEINPHEYTHLAGDLAYWNLFRKGEAKSIDVQTGKAGIAVFKPHPPYITQNEEILVRGRGLGLTEAITVELTNQWAKSFNARLDIQSYPEERQVLNSLVKLVAQEKRISEDEAFKYFARGYFNPEGFRQMIEVLDGKDEASGGKIKRPSFTPIIYGLMEIDKIKAKGSYPLTLGYINVSLTGEQKQEIIDYLRNNRNSSTNIFSPAAARQLAGNLA